MILKIAAANKILIPAMAAVKFPDFEVNYSDGKTLKLPIKFDANAVEGNSPTSALPVATLLCLSFRASSQVHFGILIISCVSWYGYNMEKFIIISIMPVNDIFISLIRI